MMWAMKLCMILQMSPQSCRTAMRHKTVTKGTDGSEEMSVVRGVQWSVGTRRRGGQVVGQKKELVAGRCQDSCFVTIASIPLANYEFHLCSISPGSSSV